MFFAWLLREIQLTDSKQLWKPEARSSPKPCLAQSGSLSELQNYTESPAGTRALCSCWSLHSLHKFAETTTCSSCGPVPTPIKPDTPSQGVGQKAKYPVQMAEYVLATRDMADI